MHKLLRSREEKEKAWWSWTHLSKAGSIDGLGVILLTEVQVMHVEGTARDADPFCNLIVLLQPGEIKAQWINPRKKDLFFLVLLQSWADLRNNSFLTDGETKAHEDKIVCLRSGTELAG